MHIQVEALQFSFPNGKQCFAGVSLQVPAGQALGVVGANGAGKSTLLFCIGGIHRCPTGMVRIDELDLGLPEHRKRLPQYVGIVFQDSTDQLFCSSVAEEVAFGPINLGKSKVEVASAVERSLAHVGMLEAKDRVPRQLSGGEQRKVALASVLAMEPQLLLLDEPTMFLDPRSRKQLATILNSLAITKMVASHDLGFIRKTCERVIVLDQGKIIRDGPTDVLDEPEILQILGQD
ncbi:MAG: energy-coupling factor ABC transporter ATP-binding protein [Zavarzinella sp.]